MEISQILKNLVTDLSKNLNLQCILQFGSSTTNPDADDIDLVLFSKELIFPKDDYMKLFRIIKDYEEKHDVVFDIGGEKRKKKARYSIGIVPINDLDIKSVKKSDFTMDLFFFKNLSEDKSKIVLYGKDPTDFGIKLNNSQISQILSLEVNHTLRKCLEDEQAKKDAMYYLFKTTLRLMLANQGAPQKEQLRTLFKETYPTIQLPSKAENIINNNLRTNYFEDILQFSEDCLKFLAKS